MKTFLQFSYFPSMGSLKYAFKATVATLLALYVALLMNLDQPSWAATTAFIVAQPQAGMVFSKGLTRLVGTVVGTVISIIVMVFFAQIPILVLLSVALILMISVAASTVLRSAWSYSFMMTGITAAIILVPNLESPTIIFDYAMARCLEISLGIIISSLIFGLIWPTKTHPLLIQEADKSLQLGFASAIKSLQGIALDEAFLQSLSNIIAIDTQREHALFEGRTGRNRANAILGMSQNILNVLSLARSIYRDKQSLSAEDWATIEPWITQSITALENKNRTETHHLLKSLQNTLYKKNNYSEATHITLHRIQLLLKHALLALRFLHSARINRPIKLINEGSLSQHRNYRLGIIFGLRSACAFLSVATLWYLTGWSLVNALMPLTMSAIICSIFAGRENAGRIALMFCKGSIYAVIISLILNIYLLPDANNFEMMAIAIGVPIFICSLTALNPKLFVYSSLPINFLMLIRPDNHLSYSVEYVLNQSLGLILGASIAALCIHLIAINMPYWHSKILKNLILKDLIRLIDRPIYNSNTWFNTRMADRLILLARHKESIEKYSQYRWKNAVLALDLGDEIFFLRRVLLHHPQLRDATTRYFSTLSKTLKSNPDDKDLVLLEDATQDLNQKILASESQNHAQVLLAATSQIQKIWLTWCQTNNKEEMNGTS